MRVCVVGGGRAGTEAAREACLRGADVTVIETKNRPTPDWDRWPELIDGRQSAARPLLSLAAPAPARVLTAEAVSVSEKCVLLARGGMVSADAFIIAAGSEPEPTWFSGWRKQGVWVMDSPSKYSGLGSAAGDRTVVAGEGEGCFRVAEKLAHGRQTFLLATCWQDGPPGAEASSVMRDAAASAGVSILSGELEGALGPETLEAVLVDGKVVTSDTLAYVPRRRPRRAPVQPSSRCGVRVGLDGRSERPNMLAAGGSAEVLDGVPPRASLDREQGVSGRIAGANATGANLTLPRYRVRKSDMFGLVWTRFGATAFRTRMAGDLVASRGIRWDERTSCSIFYERKGGVIMGIETVEEGSLGWQPYPYLGQPPTLKSLAYGGAWGSSDISVVSETARLGLRTWLGS